MAKNYKGKSNEEKEKKVNDLLDKAEKGIESIFDSQADIKSLGDFISKFYNYSIRNTLLIQKQFQGALAVGSYAFWKTKGFLVNKGEKGIKILAPNKRSEYFINENGESISIKKATEKEKELIKKGELEVLTGKLSFSQGYVFDVSQTNAKADDLPKIFPNRWLEGDVENYDLMYKAMENIAKSIGVKIIDPPYELGISKGASYPLTKEIALNPRNNQLQNVKTLIHELAHAKLHTIDKQDEYTKSAKEFQAELTAYTVCKYFRLDTEEYSFRYINEWTKDIELKNKEKLLNEVKETVHQYIDVIEDTLSKEKSLERTIEAEKEITIEDKELKEFLGKDKVAIKEISKEEFEKKIEENKSYKFLENGKKLNFKNYILATKEKDTYKDMYVNKEYKIENLIYIDDNNNLFKIINNKLEDDLNLDIDLYSVKEEEKLREDIEIGERKSFSNILSGIKDKLIGSLNNIFKNDRDKEKLEMSIKEVEIIVDEEIANNELEIEKEREAIKYNTIIDSNIKKEKLLSMSKDELIQIYENGLSKNNRLYLEQRGIDSSSIVNEFIKNLDRVDIDNNKDFSDYSLESYNDRVIYNLTVKEAEDYFYELQYERLEKESLGEEEYVTRKGKYNELNTYVPYYIAAYESYKSIDKDKIYSISNNDFSDENIEDKIKIGDKFKIEGYSKGEYIIRFPEKDIEYKADFYEITYNSKELREVADSILNNIKYVNEKIVNVNELEDFKLKTMMKSLNELKELDDKNFKMAFIFKETGIDDLEFLNRIYKTLENNNIGLTNDELVKDYINLNKNIQDIEYLDKIDFKSSEKEHARFEDIKEKLEIFYSEDKINYEKAIIGIDKGIENYELLYDIYNNMKDKNLKLISNRIEEIENYYVEQIVGEKKIENEKYLDKQFQENNKEKSYYDENVLKIKIAKVLEEKVYSGVPINEIERETKKFLDNTADVEKINLMIKEKGFKESIEHVSEVFLFLGAVDNYNAFIIGEKEIMRDSAIKKAREELKNEKGLDYKHNRNRTVEVLYSEVPGFKKGEKLTIKEAMAIFKEEVEFGAEDKAVEFKFSLNENIKYNEEFIIDKGSSVDLLEYIEEKIEDNYALRELITDYLKNNDLEFVNKGIEKELNKEKEKEMELE